MASKYTSVVYIQGNSRRRYRGYVSATVTNVSATQSRIDWTARVEMYNASQYGVAVTCTVDGTQRGSDEGYLSSSPGTTYKTVASTSGSTTFSRGSSSRSVSVAVRAYGKTVSGYGSAGGSASVSVSVTIPAIDYSAPSAPSSCAAERVSDTQAKVTWVNGSTGTTTPRSSTKVERQTDDGSWVQVASVGASVTSYTDNSVGANHRYAYRVRASGAGGNSSYATSGYVYTTPAAPASVSVAVVTGTTCSVDVDGSNAPWVEEWEVQSQLNGGDWQEVGTYATFPQTVDLGGGTVKVRARAVRGDLASDYVESAAITTITPPLAPTVSLSPSGVAPTGSVVGVSWVPNHPDGSAQTQAQVEYTVGDGSPVTADVTGTGTAYQLPETATASATTISVSVRTHGADEEWGAWSQPVTLAVAVPPEVTITFPETDGAVVDSVPVNLTWDVVDATGVASQELAVVSQGGVVLHSARLDGGARSYQLGPSTFMPDNLSSYEIRLTVRGGSSLTSTEERPFSTDWAEPAEPEVDVELGEDDLSYTVTAWHGTEEGAPDTVSMTVARVLPDGSTWTFGEGVGNGESRIDRLPPLNEDVTYRVTAYAASGATSVTEVVVRVVTWDWAYNFAPDASTCVLLSDDQKWSVSPRRSYELFDFADGGTRGGLPVAYESDALSCSGTQSFSLLDEPEKARALWAVARSASVVGWVRSPFGTRQRAAVEIDLSGSVAPGLASVSLKTTEVAFEEARVG